MTVFRTAILRTFFFAIFAGAKELSEGGEVIAIDGDFCLLKMMKCWRRQATDPKKLKKSSAVVLLFFVSGSGSV